jgi:hypothetical protein
MLFQFKKNVVVLLSTSVLWMSFLNGDALAKTNADTGSKSVNDMPSTLNTALERLKADMIRVVPIGVPKILFVAEIQRSDQPTTWLKRTYIFEENGVLKTPSEAFMHDASIGSSSVEMFLAEAEKDVTVLNMAVFLNARTVTIEFQYDRDIIEGEDDFDRKSALIEKFFGHPWVYVPEEDEDLKPGFDKDGNPLPRVLDDDDEEWGESDWGPQPKD